jgi:hypothetical protein
MVDGYNAVRYCKRAGDTALDAKRLIAVAAGNGKTIPVFFLDFYFRPDLNVFQRPRHVLFVCTGKGAVILAQLSAQAPLFVYIDLFHSFAPCFGTKKTLTR